MRLESGGAFDISFGARAKVAPRPGLAPLDPSGVVKGWAVARAGDLLREAGASSYFINAGGDIQTRGHADGADGWRVGIQHPWERDLVAAVLRLSHAARAPSGRCGRGAPALEPRTAPPATGRASATGVRPRPAMAEACP